MKRLFSHLTLIVPLLSGIVFTSCQSDNLINLTTSKQEVNAYYKDGYFGKEAYDIIEDAMEQLSDINITSNAMVVFDVDETVLSNYAHIESVGFGWAKSLWDEWLLSAKAKNIPQVKKIYDYLIENNIHVAFLTGRNESKYDATFQNLKNEGFAKFDTLICRGAKESKMSAFLYKNNKRKMLTEKGNKIIMCIGDQWSDLDGENNGIKIKIPNYLYEIK